MRAEFQDSRLQDCILLRGPSTVENAGRRKLDLTALLLVIESLALTRNLVYFLEVEPTLEALDFRFIRKVLADAVPRILAEGCHQFFQLLVLQVTLIVSTYLLSRPNDAAGGSLVLAIALSLLG